MTLLRKGGPIRLGDKLIHGGQVVHVRYASVNSMYGQGIAHRGDLAQCHKHNGLFPFIEGCYGRSSYGSGIVLEGHRLACGCYAISSGASTFMISDWFPGGLGTALLQAHADGRPLNDASRWTPPLLPDEYFAPPDTPADPLVTLRIGLFFDGTGNNAGNTLLNEQCSAQTANDADKQVLAECKAYMTRGSSEGHSKSWAGSYGNAVSNISRLFRLYQDDTQIDRPLKNGDTYSSRLYIDGIGTQAGEKDATLGMVTGAGSTGIIARVDEALSEQLHEILKIFTEQHPNAWATDILFDVFGFSRGAAAARYAVNRIKQEQRGPLALAIAPSTLKLAPGFDWATHIRVGVVGLFDTVAHLGHFPGDPQTLALHTGVDICLRDGCADAVIHLTARDEHRANFPLTSASPPWRDTPLAGVHADIGGGYRDGVEDILLTRPVVSDESISTPLEKSQAWKEATKHLKKAQNANPALADKIDVHVWAVPGSAGDALMQWLRGPIQKVGAAVRLRHTVSGAYPLVTMRIMHALAQDKGVPWQQSPDDIPTLSLTDELKPIAVKLLAYARGDAYDLSPEQEKTLATTYLHHSSNWNMLLPNDSEPLAIYYIDRPTDDGKRVIFPNQGASS